MAAGAQVLDVRSKMIGVLLRAARLKAGKTVKECAQWLGCSPHIMSQYEYGRRAISLPELELLAQLFRMPVSQLWDEDTADLEPPADRPPVEKLLRLRHKEVGVLLRQARSRAGKTQRQCAHHLGVSPETVSKYEHGSKAMPITHLEIMADFLGVSVSDFLDRELHASEAFGTTYDSSLLPVEEAWANLPWEIRDFIRSPDSLPFLQMAVRLYELPRESLRRVAEAVLSAEGSGGRSSQ